MVAVDTNLIVRLLTRDDEEQFQRSLLVFTNAEILIPETVLLETEWVLRYAYSFSREAIADALKKVMNLPNVSVENPERVLMALEWHLSGLDFADALHLAASQDASDFLTFDREFVRRSISLGKCKVSEPT